MKKTLFILIVVALLGILAAVVAPGSKSAAGSTTTSQTTTTQTTNNTTTATAVPSSTTTAPSINQYKDGTYTGTMSSNQFDQIQVAVVITGGKITDVTTPTLYGDSGRSTQINSYAAPRLNQQVISAQSSSIDGISGASYTTESYVTSLQSALDQAKA